MSSEAFTAPSVKFQPPVAVCWERRNVASASRIGCGAPTAASPSVPKMSSDSDDAAPGSYSRRPSNSASVSATKLRSAVISVGSMPAACAASSERARSVPRGPAPAAAQSACARSCALGPSPTRTSAGCSPPAASAVSPNPPSPEPFGCWRPRIQSAPRFAAARAAASSPAYAGDSCDQHGGYRGRRNETLHVSPPLPSSGRTRQAGRPRRRPSPDAGDVVMAPTAPVFGL